MKTAQTGFYSLPGSGERIADRVASGDWLGIARELCAPTSPEVTIDPDAYECGRHARSLSRAMVNAIVEARWYRRCNRAGMALLAEAEADACRQTFHRLIRRWQDVPGFMHGYRAAGEGV